MTTVEKYRFIGEYYSNLNMLEKEIYNKNVEKMVTGWAMNDAIVATYNYIVEKQRMATINNIIK